jgi:sulfur-carrier protein
MSERKSLTILYFGLLGERRGVTEERVESDAADPRAVFEAIEREHPLGVSPEHLRVAVNDEFVAWDHALGSGDVVAFLPPMSGG